MGTRKSAKCSCKSPQACLRWRTVVGERHWNVHCQSTHNFPRCFGDRIKRGQWWQNKALRLTRTYCVLVHLCVPWYMMLTAGKPVTPICVPSLVCTPPSKFSVIHLQTLIQLCLYSCRAVSWQSRTNAIKGNRPILWCIWCKRYSLANTYSTASVQLLGSRLTKQNQCDQRKLTDSFVHLMHALKCGMT